MELSSDKRFDDNNLEPIDAFAVQEFNFAIQLVKSIHKSLAAINQTIRGNTRPSAVISDTVFQLLRLQVIADRKHNILIVTSRTSKLMT